ncbi:hypothetical protein CS369_02595 [Candidatus Symbiopectobacterium sp. 'North America']|uniref:hypothetical protein n=1 Tax=Candidatus Symbiopectobacterium sp. 'North America' TaxID=2794574 RepID=UPI001D39A410|nr:hypothetical protein [Candidatus Symbiopectobacterium sp. 'North America']
MPGALVSFLVTGTLRQAHNVADLITEIGVTPQEQKSGIAEIHNAIAQLDQVTQQNAALVEESASAADSLNEQPANQVDLMRVFRLRAGSHVPSPTPIKAIVTPMPKLTQGAQWERF